MRALEQQLVVHRDRADLRLQAPDLVVTVIGRPLLSDACPPARKRSRHCASVAAVTPSSRERASSSSPCSSLSTASALRRDEKRPRSGRGSLHPFVPCVEPVMDTSSAGAGCPNQVSKKTVDRERSAGRGRAAVVASFNTVLPRSVSRRSSGPLTSSPRIWLIAVVRPRLAERRATRRARIASTAPFRVFGSPAAWPD